MFEAHYTWALIPTLENIGEVQFQLYGFLQIGRLAWMRNGSFVFK